MLVGKDEEYIKNLEKCKLVDAELTIKIKE
jgi:hypothetical protein